MPTSPQIDPIHIFYPNGGNQAVQVYVWDGVKPILWNGQVTFSGTISIGTVSGTLTNNNAAPAANNFGVLPAIVSSTNLSYTVGNQALLRVDTTGALVVSATLSTTGLATSANQTNGTQVTSITTGTAVIGKLVASTPYSTTSTNTVVTVTTSPAIITAYYIGNSNTTTAAYIQLFNATAGAVTLGSTAPTQSYYIPAGAAANVAGMRKSFTTAFSIAASLGRSSSTAPATALDVNFDFE